MAGICHTGGTDVGGPNSGTDLTSGLDPGNGKAVSRPRSVVVATASRSESAAWVRALGAAYVVNHAAPLAAQVAALPGLPPASVVKL
jgi:hypothetical protein